MKDDFLGGIVTSVRLRKISYAVSRIETQKFEFLLSSPFPSLPSRGLIKVTVREKEYECLRAEEM